MDLPHSRSVAAVAGHTIDAALDLFVIASFKLVLATDVLFWRTGDLMWQNFSPGSS
jgi:uncharacterized membrane protein